MKSFLRFLIISSFFVLVVFQGFRAWERRVEGFAIEKIQSDIAYDPTYDIPVSNEKLEQVNAILSQPYYYLGHGFQSYVFVSQDDRYVVKFMRYQRMRLSKFATYLPDISIVRKFKKRKEAEFEVRKEYLFSGFKIGYERALDETALVYVHLNKTQNKHGILTIYDKIGNPFTVELDQVEFAVQKKARHTKPVIDELMSKGEIELAKKRIEQIFELFIDCAKKGVYDTDGALVRKNNLGYLDNRAIYIDSGKLCIKSKKSLKECFQYDMKRMYLFEKWLKNNYPELATHYVKTKDRIINEL